MNLQSVKVGDIIEIDKKGRRFHALVEEKESHSLTFRPLQRGISYRTASAREVVDHWQRPRRRSR